MNEGWRAFDADPLQGEATSPYPGLRPFLPRERDIFFGREQMIDQVLVRLNERHMVVVHGASGCGKSSLIAAGVLPQLARRRARRGLVLKTGTFRPGITPMQSLVGLLGELCASEAGPASLEDVYRAISGGAAARAGVARLAAAAGVDQICIVVDQFEELFRFAEDEGFEEAQRFAELLVRLCGCDGDEAGWWEAEDEGEEEKPARDADGAEISFILTMRSEFLGNCARYPGLAEAINRTQYLLPNMARGDLIRAIREPAEVFEGNVDHALAERMADDAAREEDSLPLVQHALMQMWQKAAGGVLTIADYERTLDACAQSDASRQRGPLSAILAGHADQVLAEVTGGDPAKLSAAEFIFRALTRKDGESRAIRFPQRFWRLARVSGVSRDEALAIVDGFRRDGVSFLTPYAAMAQAIDGDTVVDISHEALIRAWPRMSDKAIDPVSAQPVGWIEREAQDAMLWRWLAVHAAFFRANPRAYLDGATTERLGAWFERIQRRPDWVRPHLVRPEGRDEVTDEPEWRSVAHLLKESHARNWLDRTMLRRWKKLGRFSLVLLAALVAGAIVVGTLISRRIAAGAVAEDAQQQVVISMRATDAFVREANLRKTGGGAAQTEAVDDETVARATAHAGGAATQSNVGEAVVWIGTTDPAGHVTASNLLDGGGHRIAPDRVAAGARLTMAGNALLRAGYPSADGHDSGLAIGLIGRTSPVRIADLRSVAYLNRVEHWARVDLRPQSPPPVQLALANDSTGGAADLSDELAGLGYARPAAAQPAPAPGIAEALYCGAGGRDAAFRLAAQATRWVAQVPGMQSVVVTPRQDGSCGAAGSGPIVLRIYLARADTGWINGRWAVDGNCAASGTIATRTRQLVVDFQGRHFEEAITSATDRMIVTDRAIFSRSGAAVDVLETIGGTAIPYRITRCGR